MCARSGEKTRWLNPAPCTAAKGMYLVGARKQELPGATLLGNAADVTRKRNGGEHAWSFLRISRVFGLSSTKPRCRGCIGCEQTAARRDGRPKNASTGTGLSDVDIPYDQPSRGQKFATLPEEISSARCRERSAVCRRLVTPISQGCSRKRTSAAATGMPARGKKRTNGNVNRCPSLQSAYEA